MRNDTVQAAQLDGQHPPRGMRVGTRLLLIIAACLIPTLALYAVIGFNLWSERREQLADLALQQASMLAADVNSIAEGGHILLTSAAASQQDGFPSADCSDRLAEIQHHVPNYLFLAYVGPAGTVECASDPGLTAQQDNHLWSDPARSAEEFTAGRYTRTAQYPLGFMPLYYPLRSGDGGHRGTLVAMLDPGWLEQHLIRLKRGASPFLSGGVLTIADAGGVIVARDVQQAEFIGKRFPPAAIPLVQAQEPGTLRIKSIDGTQRLIGYSPPLAENHGLAVAVGFYEPDLMANLRAALLHWAMLLVSVTVAVFFLTILVARRGITRPTRNLLAIAHRWQQGELTARAPLTNADSEFGQLAVAYNMMAAALQCREEKLRAHAAAQEQQVAERTRELTLANERLTQEIAERQNTEAALLQAQKVQAVGQLAGGIAHDFNNILQVVSGSADLIRRRPSDEAMVRRLGNTIHDAARRGASITRRLLAFSRREELCAEVLDLRELTTGLHEILSATLGAGIAVHAKIPDHLPSVSVDRGQLETVLVNLATNARDAMPQGGELRIVLSEQRLVEPNEQRLPFGDYVCITVADTGEGMDAATLARATEPFFTTKPLGQGTGLGLAMARGFAEGSGGRLFIGSQRHVGTQISLWLPAAGLAAPSRRAESLPCGARPLSGRAARVLLVDDDPVVRGVLAEPLRDDGFDVVEAGDCAAALRLLEADPNMDLLITDLAMPGPDGLTLIREAQRVRPSLPAILITGYAGTAATLAIGTAVEGRFSLLRKPVSAAQLLDQATMLTPRLHDAAVAQI